ncbi:MAG: tetratricopeptide repeat protein [Planctomycetes bacterium]|nr:tetratricopeptide repeat protein [Planctomycetota bacterium]
MVKMKVQLFVMSWIAGVLILLSGCSALSGGKGVITSDPALSRQLYAEGLALQEEGKLSQAIELFERATKADARHARVWNHYAWLLATNKDAKRRNGARAVELAEQACKYGVTPGKATKLAADCLDTLAAAYAEAGRFDDAIRAAERAVEQSRRMRSGRRYPSTSRAYMARLELYRRGRPYHEPVPVRPRRRRRRNGRRSIEGV